MWRLKLANSKEKIINKRGSTRYTFIVNQGTPGTNYAVDGNLKVPVHFVYEGSVKYIAKGCKTFSNN